MYPVDVSHLHKKFSTKIVVNDFSLRVEKGERIGFIGANGSGKTTTLRMLAGLVRPENGNGQIIGYDLLHATQAIRQHIGYMTQHYALYPTLTVRENLAARAAIYHLPQRSQRVDALIETSGLSAFSSQRIANLSGGWMRRAQFAAAILHAPSLLLLDEPTAGLDYKAKTFLWQAVAQLGQQGTTMIVSTHDRDEAAQCDRLIFFEQGNIIAQGPTAELLSQVGSAYLTGAMASSTEQPSMKDRT